MHAVLAALGCSSSISFARSPWRQAERAKTITEAHLRATAPLEDRVKEMLNAALLGEEDLAEPEGADERLLGLLGLRESTRERAILAPSHKPGVRAPGRDPIGPEPDAGREPAVG